MPNALLCAIFCSMFQLICLPGCKRPIYKESSIIAVAMLTRHGMRTPAGTYPNDPYASYPWLGGYGALTAQGSNQLYSSGLNKAARYKSLFNNPSFGDLGPDDIYVRSSSSNRCVLSAKSFLQGFVPSFCERVHMSVPPPEEDPMLSSAGRRCTKYEKEINMRLDLPGVLALTENGTIIEYMRYHSGWDVPDLIELSRLCDYITVQHDYGLSIPAWAASILPSYIEPLLNFTFFHTSCFKQNQIKAGVLLLDIIQRFDKFLNACRHSESPRVLLYSAHDVTILPFLILLETFDQVGNRPDYGAMVALELHEVRTEAKTGVEIVVNYFRNAEDKNPLKLNIPGCDEPCTYNKFKELMHPKLVFDFDLICEN